MSEQKNNHYVPQFYLRLFATSPRGKAVDLFNINSKKLILNCSIKHQASRDYFYGQDGVTENFLAESEGLAAPILHSIIAGKQLPPPMSEDHITLLAFISNLKERTIKGVKGVEDNIDRLMKIFLLSNKEFLNKFSPETLEEIRIGFKNGPQYLLGVNAFSFLLMRDLGMKVIVNESSHDFITSDHPVISYNQFMLQKHHHSAGTGFASKGLQLLFPLSPKVMLVLFDKDIYKIGARNAQKIFVKDNSEIDLINTLQIINASENLYFANARSGYEIESILKDSSVPRARLDSAPSVIEIPHETDPNQFLLKSTGWLIRTYMPFSFIKLTKKAKWFELDQSRLVYVRNERMVADHEQFIEQQRNKFLNKIPQNK